VVPWTALTATPEGPAVWRVDPGTMQVQLAPVEVTAYSDDMVEISAGVAAGDLVVGSGSQFLYPGRVVSDAGDLK
jgi:multidrug efflux pump subunit AcrA (membrane-fusion protein)